MYTARKWAGQVPNWPGWGPGQRLDPKRPSAASAGRSRSRRAPYPSDHVGRAPLALRDQSHAVDAKVPETTTAPHRSVDRAERPDDALRVGRRDPSVVT